MLYCVCILLVLYLEALGVVQKQIIWFNVSVNHMMRVYCRREGLSIQKSFLSLSLSLPLFLPSLFPSPLPPSPPLLQYSSPRIRSIKYSRLLSSVNGCSIGILFTTGLCVWREKMLLLNSAQVTHDQPAPTLPSCLKFSTYRIF